MCFGNGIGVLEKDGMGGVYLVVEHNHMIDAIYSRRRVFGRNPRTYERYQK